MRGIVIGALTLLLVSFNVFASCGSCDSCCGDVDMSYTVTPVRGYWQCANPSADRDCDNYNYIEGYSVAVPTDD